MLKVILAIAALILTVQAIEYISEKIRLAGMTSEQVKTEQHAKQEEDFRVHTLIDTVEAVRKTLRDPTAMGVYNAKYSIGDAKEGACLEYKTWTNKTKEESFKMGGIGIAVMQVYNHGEKTRFTMNNRAHWNAVCTGTINHDSTERLQRSYAIGGLTQLNQ